MGFGKMIAGLFKKDDEDGFKGGMSKSNDVSAESAGEERINKKGTMGSPDSRGESAGLPGAEKAVSTDSPDAEITENKILEVLSNVYDPEIPIDIVNLGLIYGIDIEGGNVRISMTMTAPGCPASTQIAGESKILVEEIPGVKNVEIELVWDPPWDPSKMSEEAQQSLGIF